MSEADISPHRGSSRQSPRATVPVTTSILILEVLGRRVLGRLHRRVVVHETPHVDAQCTDIIIGPTVAGCQVDRTRAVTLADVENHRLDVGRGHSRGTGALARLQHEPLRCPAQNRCQWNDIACGPVRCGVIDRVRLGAGTSSASSNETLPARSCIELSLDQAEGQVSVVVGVKVAARGLNIDNVAIVVGVPVPSALAARLIVGAVTPASAGEPTSSKSASDRLLRSIVSVKVTLNTTVSVLVMWSLELTPVSKPETRSTELTSGLHRIDRATAGVGRARRRGPHRRTTR